MDNKEKNQSNDPNKLDWLVTWQAGICKHNLDLTEKTMVNPLPPHGVAGQPIYNTEFIKSHKIRTSSKGFC